MFIRDNKNVKLTKSGEAFLPYVKRMIMLKKDGIIRARAMGIYEDRLAVGLAGAIYKGVISPDENSYVVDFVKEGFGYAFVTKSSVDNELEKGELIQVKIKDSLPPSRQIYMIINKNKKDSAAIRNWLEVPAIKGKL